MSEDKELTYQEKIIAIRKEQLTQKEVAQLINVSGNTIRNWEYGITEPNDMHKEKIDDLYKYVVEEKKVVTKKQRIRVSRKVDDIDVELWD